MQIMRALWIAAGALPSIVLAASLLPCSALIGADDWREATSVESGEYWNGENNVEIRPVETLPYATWESSQESSGELPEPISIFIGYDRGFVIANHGQQDVTGSDFPFLMRVNSWFQLRHTLFDSDGPNADQNSISFERLRLAFSGHAFSPDWEYFFQFDGNSDRSTEVIFLDYFGTYDIGKDRFGRDANRLQVKFGKWKVPFSRSREESGRRLQFTDRATANILFDLNRSFGVGLFGQLDPSRFPLHYETAVFNGFTTGNTNTTRGAGLDRNFGWSMRTHIDLISEFGNDGEPDLQFREVPTLRIGSGFAFTRVDNEGATEFGRQRVVDSGQQLQNILPAGVGAYDLWLSTVDAHWKYRGFSTIAEYYWRDIAQFRGVPVAALRDHGFVLQMGYFLRPTELELVTRWSHIAGESGTLGLMNQSSDEVAMGLVWYFNGHNGKLTFDVTHINGSPVSSSRLDMLPSDVGWLYRTQFQLAF